MTDINKMVEMLKELEAKATPKPWNATYAFLLPENTVPEDVALAVVMRNALPELLAELDRRGIHAEKAEAELKRYVWEEDEDLPLPEDHLIDATFPTLGEGAKELCRADMEAMRLVGAKRSKRGLVNLVRWLILEKEKEGDKAEALKKKVKTLSAEIIYLKEKVERRKESYAPLWIMLAASFFCLLYVTFSWR